MTLCASSIFYFLAVLATTWASSFVYLFIMTFLVGFFSVGNFMSSFVNGMCAYRQNIENWVEPCRFNFCWFRGFFRMYIPVCKQTRVLWRPSFFFSAEQSLCVHFLTQYNTNVKEVNVYKVIRIFSTRLKLYSFFFLIWHTDKFKPTLCIVDVLHRFSLSFIKNVVAYIWTPGD